MYLIILIVLIILAGYFYIRYTPKGMVEFKSGIVLKLLPSLDQEPPIKIRGALEKFVAKTASKLNASLPVKRVEDLTIPTRHGEIKARLYDQELGNADRLLVYFHGGGWCIGSIDTHNEQTRRLAISTGLPILSINYSLSPEVKFPHAFEECVDALVWAIKNSAQLGAQQSRVVPIGDSAGGNLAITTTIQLIKDGWKEHIAQVVPIYPVTSGAPGKKGSFEEFKEGYYLTAKAMHNFSSDYLSYSSDALDPRTSPLLEEDLSFFPPCFILTAGFDPLRDEGEAFAHKLHQQGVPVVLKRYPNALHAFFGLKDFGHMGLIAIEDVADYLNGKQVQQTLPL